MVLVIMRESLPGAEKRKEKREEIRRRTAIKIENEIGTERGGEVGTGRGRGTRIGKETETGIGIRTGTGRGTVTGIVIDITGIATGTEVREGSVEEIGMMMMMKNFTAAVTMTGNTYE